MPFSTTEAARSPDDCPRAGFAASLPLSDFASLIQAKKLPAQISRDGIVQVIPIRIDRVDKPNLPGARPVLDRFLALDGIADIIKIFRIDKFLQAITLRKSLDESLAVLKYPTR